MRNEIIANQTSLGAAMTTGAIHHNVAAGIEAVREDTFTRNSAQSTNQPQTDLRAPNPAEAALGQMPEITGNPGDTRTATIGAYLFDTVALSSQWEVTGGLRWDRSDVVYRQMTLATGDGTLFHTEKTNARTRNLANDPFVLAGRHRVAGVELSASGELAPGWTAIASYAFMDSEIVASANPADLDHDLTLTPEHTASFWVTGEITRRLTIGGGAQFMDAVFRNTTTDLRVPSYWLVNAMATYEVNSHPTSRSA
jgi:outer membrane receptor for monomeric catechols